MIHKFINMYMSSGLSSNEGTMPAQKILIMSMCFTLIISAAMAVTYRFSHNQLTYNRKFNITLVMLACISTVLLTLVQTNPLFSLGVLGSLSICRIRMNTKDPRDLGFVFWALSIGIASAEGAYFAGTFCAIILSVILIFSSRTSAFSTSEILVIRGERSELMTVRGIFNHMRGVTVQSENIFEDSFELVYEINMNKRHQHRVMAMLNSLKGINGVNLLAPETQAV